MKLHTIRAMSHNGDDLIAEFDPKDKAAAKSARSEFNRCRAAGLVPYEVDEEGGKVAVLNRFDPEVKSVLFANPIVGG